MGVHDTKLNTSIVQGHALTEINTHVHKVANINFQCKARPTALYTAVVYNNVEAAALLLERGADMMVVPLKKCVKNESECALLMAFKQGESHEDMQLLLLRHLSNCNCDKFDSVALKNIARVAQYAMMYCSTRAFFAAEEMKIKMGVVKSTGFNPLMFTVIQVGLFEDNVATCVKIFEHILEIVDKDSTMLWQRYYSTIGKQQGALRPYTGGTALGMLLFHVMADREKRCTEYAEYLDGVVRGNARMAQYMPSTDPHHDGFVQFVIEREAEQKSIHEKNLAVMSYFTKELAPCLFAKMLPSMRVALAMGTHPRLGDQKACGVRQLNADIMNVIFNQLVSGIVTSPEDYKFMCY